MTRPTPPPKSRRRRLVERELASLRGVTSVAAELGRSRMRIAELALRLDLGSLIDDAGNPAGIRLYWPEDVEFLRDYIAEYGRTPAPAIDEPAIVAPPPPAPVTPAPSVAHIGGPRPTGEPAPRPRAWTQSPTK